MKSNKKTKPIFRAAVILVVLAALTALLCVGLPVSATETLKRSKLLDDMMNYATSYVVVYHKQLGGSHYAYTEGLAEELGDGNRSSEGNEATFRPGSKMTLVTLSYKDDKVVKEEKTLVNCPGGVIRDPDVSKDGSKVVFSMKNNAADDYHLYVYDLATNKSTQITFGNGQADIEPVFNADGSIIFNSTRDTQTVDCWKTPVSNMYKCDADGKNIIRLGYDQVHTTYPTTAEDGRIIYTRWDYNDRNQMYVQAVFQMFSDGTGQTEIFGNNVNNPTTLLHTREIPGNSGKYVSIVCGHHIYQCGKLAVIDTAKGRNNSKSLTYVWPDSDTRELEKKTDNDTSNYQSGRVYKYPYAISDSEFLVSTCKQYNGGDTPFDIMLINTDGDSVRIAKGSSSLPASQIVPIKTSNIFNRASMVDYSGDTGTYYVANVYEGQKGIEAGTIKYLRVVGLEFRSSAIGATVGRGTGSSDPYSPIATGNGAWDVKKVLGVVPVYEDGSALFTVPSELPVYFQLLDEKGDVVQTMRSWSTLQPGEYFSCVGCHVDKNYTPTAGSTTTEAMKKGVSKLEPDLWMKSFEEYEKLDPYGGSLIGFDYLSVVQPILDKNCISCHGDTKSAYKSINAGILGCDDRTAADFIINNRDDWYFTTEAQARGWTTSQPDSGKWMLSAAPFGRLGIAPGNVNTVVRSDRLYLRKTVNCTEYDIKGCSLGLNIAYTGKIEIFVNGKSVYTGNRAMSSYENIALDSNAVKAFKVGKNEIAISLSDTDGNVFVDSAILSIAKDSSGSTGKRTQIFDRRSEWKYITSAKEDYSTSKAGSWTEAGFDDSAWKTGKTPFGNRLGGQTTDWTQNGKNYLWARKTFNVDDPAKFGSSFALYLDTFYDDTVSVYLNGVKIFGDERWTDDYVSQKISLGSGIIKKGENVIAVSLHQHVGGYEFDLGLYALETDGDFGISLESVNVLADRMKKYFPMSYLVLTQSKAEKNGDRYQWVANSVNGYTNWVSSMSQCEMLDPYAYGAHNSTIISMLRSGHGNLTEEEIRAIACWIDLGVPCYGDYEKGENWNANDRREYEEELNKRNFYDMLDEYAKLALAGKLPDKELTVTYKPSTGSELIGTGRGIVILNTKTQFKKGDTLRIKLPDGVKYVAVSLSSRIGESILYSDKGEITITLPALDKCFPNTFTTGQGCTYRANTITVRIVSDEELTRVHNLARNSYDSAASKNVFPHVTSSGVRDGNDCYAARNVIDGFTMNKSAGNYPGQSWQPDKIDENTRLCIDFGRKIKVSELAIKLRRAANDSHFTDCKLTFSDGSSVYIRLSGSDDMQYIELGDIETTSITFSDFTVEPSVGSGSAAISEIEVLGTEILG